MHLLINTLGAAFLAATASAAPAAQEQEDGTVVLIKAEKVIQRAGKVLENASVLVQDGRIVAVGTDITAPAGAQVIEGKVVCAGFIDPWTSFGLTSGAANGTDTKASTRSLDGIDPFSAAHLRTDALRAGVVVARVQAGARSTIAGLSAVVRVAGGDDMLLLDDAALGMAVGLSGDAFDRVGQVDSLANQISTGLKYREDWVEYQHELSEWQEAIVKAEEKLEKDFKKAKKDRDKKKKEADEEGEEFKEKSHKEDKKPKAPKYDADKAVLARVAHGEVSLFVHARGLVELRELLKATAGFDRLRLVIEGATGALHVADELAARSIPVIVHPAPSGGRGVDLSLAGQLAEKDVKVLLGSGGGSAIADLPLLAAIAIGHGLDADDAFHALTLGAAEALDIADQVGSVRRGRRADLLVLSGDPLSSATQVQYVLSNGQVVVSPGN